MGLIFLTGLSILGILRGQWLCISSACQTGMPFLGKGNCCFLLNACFVSQGRTVSFFFFPFLFLCSVCQSSLQTCDYVRQLQPNLKRASIHSGSAIYHLLFSSAATWFLYQKRQWTVTACVPFLCVFFLPEHLCINCSQQKKQNAKELSK